MYFTCVCHCSTIAPTGLMATVSINPVCKPVRTSAMGRAPEVSRSTSWPRSSSSRIAVDFPAPDNPVKKTVKPCR
mgnify:CR=1 FL=1